MEKPVDVLEGRIKKGDGDEKQNVIKILRRPEVKKDGFEEMKKLVDGLGDSNSTTMVRHTR